MNKLLLTSALVGVALLGVYTPKADAGWGPPFACGAGQKTGKIAWDGGTAPANEPKAAITGVTVKAPAEEVADSEWTVEELKAAKPILVYYYVDGLTQESGDDSFKFASTWEQGCLVDKVVDQINTSWAARKVGLDVEADRKLEKNQARIEFWSFTNVKMTTISVDQRNLLNPGAFRAMLKKYETKNEALCAKELKRIEAAQKAREALEKKDESSAAK